MNKQPSFLNKFLLLLSLSFFALALSIHINKVHNSMRYIASIDNYIDHVENSIDQTTATTENVITPTIAVSQTPSITVTQTPSIAPTKKKAPPKEAENPDFFALLTIPDVISTPVMFTPSDLLKQDKTSEDDRYFYLHRNLDKEYDSHGIPFLDMRTDLNASDNFIIYGHNMRVDHTVFAPLLSYRNYDFFISHPEIKLQTLEETMIYEIFAVLQSPASGVDGFRYYNLLNWDSTTFSDDLEKIYSLSLYHSDFTITENSKLITLSTCARKKYKEGPYKDGRLAIVGVLTSIEPLN